MRVRSAFASLKERGSIAAADATRDSILFAVLCEPGVHTSACELIHNHKEKYECSVGSKAAAAALPSEAGWKRGGKRWEFVLEQLMWLNPSTSEGAVPGLLCPARAGALCGG